MTKATLPQVFGANATQTSSLLTITKSDLASTGYTPSATDTPEAILAAILAFAQNTLSTTNQSSANTDEDVAISDSSDSLITRNSVVYRRKTKIITFDMADTGSVFNPNNY